MHRWAFQASLFAVCGLAVAWNSLAYDWNWDDLHLLRVYSADELLSTLTGHWDPDGIENAGLRPLTTVFYHAQALVLGEYVYLYRLLQVLLFAVYLTVLGGIAARLGSSAWVGIVAGAFVLAAKQSYYHLTWVTDGVHLLQGLLFAGAAHAVVRAAETGEGRHHFAALAFAALGLLTREDSLAMFPALALLALYAATQSATPHATARVLRFAGALILVAAGYWLWRWVVIPGAAQVRIDTAAIARVGDMAVATVWLSGVEGQGHARNIYLAVALLAVCATFAVLRGGERWRAALWLAAATAASSIGSAEMRPNLLFFPISFYALFLASVIVAVARRHRWMTVFLTPLLLWMVVTSVHASRTAQLSMHPLSADQIRRDWEFTYGPERHATIPAARRAYLTSKLERLGVATPDFDFDRWEGSLVRSASSRPAGDRVLLPSLHFMQF